MTARPPLHWTARIALTARGERTILRLGAVGAGLTLCLVAGCSDSRPPPSAVAPPSPAPLATPTPTTPAPLAAPTPTRPPPLAAPTPTRLAPLASPTPVVTNPANTAPSRPAAPAPLVITIRNFAFFPQNPVLAPGQAVVIINSDSAAHTWTAAAHSGWTYDSGNIAPGRRALFRGLTHPGRYPVLCLYHAEMPPMNGTVTVR